MTHKDKAPQDSVHSVKTKTHCCHLAADLPGCSREETRTVTTMMKEAGKTFIQHLLFACDLLEIAHCLQSVYCE